MGEPSLEWIIQPQIRLPILSSTSSLPVSTATTPSIFMASDEFDRLHLRMRVRAADEVRVGHAVQADVVGVPALAGDEALVFLADDAGADAFHTHGGFSSRSRSDRAWPAQKRPYC